MSAASPSPASVPREEEIMDRVAPDSENTDAENSENSTEGSSWKERKPIWFCKVVASRPLSVFGRSLCLLKSLKTNRCLNKLMHIVSCYLSSSR